MRNEYVYRASGKSVLEVFVKIGEIDSNPPPSEAVDFDDGYFLVVGTSNVLGKKSAANYLFRRFQLGILSAAKKAAVLEKQALPRNSKQ